LCGFVYGFAVGKVKKRFIESWKQKPSLKNGGISFVFVTCSLHKIMIYSYR
jgi:hypothetical protein